MLHGSRCLERHYLDRAVPLPKPRPKPAPTLRLLRQVYRQWSTTMMNKAKSSSEVLSLLLLTHVLAILACAPVIIRALRRWWATLRVLPVASPDQVRKRVYSIRRASTRTYAAAIGWSP